VNGPILTNNVKFPFEGVEIVNSEFVDIIELKANCPVYYSVIHQLYEKFMDLQKDLGHCTLLINTHGLVDPTGAAIL
jgi:hypothetical protein